MLRILVLLMQNRIFGALALSLFLSACGGGGGSSDSSSNGTPATNTSSSTASTSSRSSSAGSSSITASSAASSSAATSTGSNSSSSNSRASSSASSSSTAAVTKSAKRGIAYDLASDADMKAVSPGVSWWYNWALKQNTSLSATSATNNGIDFLPMLWNGSFDDAAVITYLKANPQIKYILVMNEPNLTDQANLTPAQAATIWPRYEAISSQTGVKIVGPAMNWGTMSGYSDPVVWLDAFYTAYEATNSGKAPQIDYLAFHWYDYGLSAQLDRLTKYGKSFWVTEFTNWHSSTDGAQIDTLAKQEAQMKDMVATLESRSDVFRYAWFTGRMNNDTHYTSLLGADGTLSELGKYYLSLPY